MSFQSKSLAGLDCQSSKWSRSSWKQCCVVTCPEVSYIHRHIQYHLIQDAPQNEETSSQSTSHSSHLILLTQIDLVSASDLATLKGKTLQECTNANQLQWWTWILLSHPSCSARKSYCLRQLRPDRVSNRPRQWIIMLLSNSGKNEKKLISKWAYKPSPKMNSSETELMKRGIDAENLWKEILFVERSTMQHSRSSSQPIRFGGRIHIKHFFRVCFLLETIFCHE